MEKLEKLGMEYNSEVGFLMPGVDPAQIERALKYQSEN